MAGHNFELLVIMGHPSCCNLHALVVFRAFQNFLIFSKIPQTFFLKLYAKIIGFYSMFYQKIFQFMLRVPKGIELFSGLFIKIFEIEKQLGLSEHPSK